MGSENPYLTPGEPVFRPLEELDEGEAREQAGLLAEAIHHHDHRYYLLDDPVISDGLYDRLFRRLREIEDRWPELRTPDSPTQRVGGAVLDALPEAEHLAPMLSLDSAADQESVREFDGRVRKALDVDELVYVAEPKFDGVSIEVVYREGRFERGATRGDGFRGEDVSANVRTIHSVPLRLREEVDSPPLLSLRGEVLMPLAGFHELNRRRVEVGEEPFANPRNAAAGALRQLDTSVAASRPLDAFFYDVLAVEGEEPPRTHWETLAWLRELGLKVSERRRRCDGIEEAIEYHDELEARRDDLPYEVDGVVVKVDRRDWQRSLGVRSRTPRWALAHKFAPREETTRIEEIALQVGRTGIISPVALLAPVEVGGVTIARASLHNYDQVRDKDVRPGDTVRVHRAGDVIPYVVERVDERPDEERSPPFDMPESCPVCGSHVERDGAYFVCTGGLACPAQLAGSVEHYGSRSALDIEGMGERTVRQLIDAGLVSESVADLYRIQVQDLLPLELFGELKATNLVEAIEDSKETTLARFFHALGIRHVGEHVARVLARELGDVRALMEADPERLQEIEEIGPEVSRSIRDFFDEERNRRVVEELLELGVSPRAEGDGRRSLEGERFVLTGALERLTREQARRRIESMGGRVTSSVSGKTDYVVLGENPGSKADRAAELGVRTIGEEELFELLAGRDGSPPGEHDPTEGR